MIDEYSRTRASAEALGENAIDRHSFLDKKVLLTGEADVLCTENGQECFRVSLILLIKICQHISVSLPSSFEIFQRECQMIVNDLADKSNVVFLDYPSIEKGFDAILCIGTQYKPNLPRTIINSNGWVARVSSGDIGIHSDCSHTNPIGAMGAACLGVTEVFKRLINLKHNRGEFFNGMSFCLLSHATGVIYPGPDIPNVLQAPIAVVGAGAIGNGILYLLRSIHWQGHIDIIDPQEYGRENIGTCLMLGPAGIGINKAQHISTLLQQTLEVQSFAMSIEYYTSNVGSDSGYPTVILNGLDNVDARYAVQDIWPDLVIDGAISDFACQVSVHPWGKDVACLQCLFQKPVESAASRANKVTGLPLSIVMDSAHIITTADVNLVANKEKKEWLSQHSGKTICSVVSEAMARSISDQHIQKGFEPSVPFVACMSAAMVITEVIKAVACWQTQLEPQFQFDILHGPAFGQFIPMARKKDCKCVIRQRNIELFRKKRYSMLDIANSDAKKLQKVEIGGVLKKKR